MNIERLEWRTAKQVGVSFPKRTIELIVMPYESEATVLYDGRVITEICSRGAFDGIQRRPNRVIGSNGNVTLNEDYEVVTVNRDHDPTRTIGKARNFDPDRDDGLFAELKISHTELGDETLELAGDEVLAASAGFLPMDGGQVWEGRDRRRLTKVWLGHIAMTPDPAYEKARVLAVRHADTPPVAAAQTPFLDQIRLRRLAEEYGFPE